MQISEELDKVTGKTGAWNIALGIITIVGGIATGVLLLVHGGKEETSIDVSKLKPKMARPLETGPCRFYF